MNTASKPAASRIAIALGLLALPAFAGVALLPSAPKDGEWQAVRDAQRIGSTHPTEEACWRAVRSDVEGRKQSGTYQCILVKSARVEWKPEGAVKPAASAAGSSGEPTPKPAAPAPAPTLASAPFMGAGHHMPGFNPALIPPPNAGAGDRRISDNGTSPRDSDIGAFRTVCDYSHMNSDDPILFPGQQGRSHLHVFFGNTLADYRSTAESIMNSGNSTCRGGIVNRSAYWVPAMIDTRDGRPIRPVESNFYYKTGYRGIKPAQVVSFPPGFRMIAGNALSTRGQEHVRYSCNGVTRWQPSIPVCTSGNVEMQVIFPQCWDGVSLTSPDGRSHVAYGNGRGCPSAFPVALPEVTTTIVYPVANGSGADSSTWRLSSDNYTGAPGGHSGHADWFHGWEQDVMEAWVKRVLQPSRDGGSHIVGDGRVIF